MTHWLILGGGPSARVNWQSIKADKIIGSNRCLEYVTPDVYWISDPLAIERYRHLWQAYTGEIICNADLGRPTTRFPYLNTGPTYGKSCSGLLCCRVALERGATKLTLVGFDGHKPDDMVHDTSDKPWMKYGEHAARRNRDMAVTFEAMGKEFPNATFLHVGPTLIVLPVAHNWSHRE